MANPEKNQNLPISENQNNGFSVEIENIDILFRIITDKQYRKNFDWDEKANTGSLGTIRIDDDLVEHSDLEINASYYLNSSKEYEYQCFCPSLSIKRKVVDSGYNLIDGQRYFKKEIALRMVENLKSKSENASYYIDQEGRQTIFIQDGDLTYGINIGFDNEEDHLKNPYPLFIVNKKDYIGRISDSTFDIFCVNADLKKLNKSYAWCHSTRIGIECGEFAKLGLTLENQDKFKNDMENFLKKCETILCCFYTAYDKSFSIGKHVIHSPFKENQEVVRQIRNSLSPDLEESSKSFGQNLNDRDNKFIFIIDQLVKEFKKGHSMSTLFAPDLNIRMINMASGGIDDKEIENLIRRAIKMKIDFCKSEGLIWTPVNTQDFCRTITFLQNKSFKTIPLSEDTGMELFFDLN